MASLLKVFILGVPKCNPNARVLIRCPMSELGWAGIWWLRRWCLGSPSSIWCRGRRWQWLSQGNPPSPSQKDDLPVILIRIPTPWWVSPRHWWGTSGGAFSSWSAISWQRSSTSWCNLWLARSPSSAWRWCRVSPLGWALSVSEWSSPSPSEGWDWCFEGSPPTAIIYTLKWVSEVAIALMAMALSRNSCHFKGSVGSTLHVLCWVKQSYQFHCWIMEHTHRLSVSQSYTYFHNVFLWHRGDIKQSGIFPC